MVRQFEIAGLLGAREAAVLQIFARRLAQALNDPAARAVFRQADETNLAKAIESQPNVLTLMADGFLKDVGNASLGGKLIDINNPLR